MIIEIIGLIEVIAIMMIMDRYLEFANHSRDFAAAANLFAAADLLSESQICLVKDAKKQVCGGSELHRMKLSQDKLHGMKLSHRLACYKFLH